MMSPSHTHSTPPSTRSRGFSLIELIVVIGIMAVLIALLLPALRRARIQAKYVACQSNMRQIGQAMMIYANNNRGWLFPPEAGLIVPMNERWFVSVLKPVPPPRSEQPGGTGLDAADHALPRR